MAESRLPLSGLRVVDLADEKGELAGRLLADLGADVIRVEPLDGAVSRRLGPFHGDHSLYFAVRNANKRTVTLDLTTGDGRRGLFDLLGSADVLIETTRPGELATIDAALDQPALCRRFDSLVVVSITDFGQTGPYRDYVATDAVMEAMAWMVFRAGVPERPPVLPPGAIAYDTAGITAAFAALTGVLHRFRTGAGQWIDLSVLEAVAQTTDWGLASFSAMNLVMPGAFSETRNGSGQIYPIVPCADGWVRPSMVTVAEWRKMRAWLGEPDALQGEALDSPAARIQIYDDLLRPLLIALFAGMTMVEASEEGQRRRIPITPLLRPADVLTAAHYREVGSFVERTLAGDEPAAVASGFYLRDGERLGIRDPAAVHDPSPASGCVARSRTARRPRRFGH